MILLHGQARTLDPWENQALEAALVDRCARTGESFFFTWRSRPAVFIGKNQNPWIECSRAALEAFGAVLARRISGGGAVYHDPGNLNASFVIPQPAYDRRRVLDVWIGALARLGIAAHSDERFGIWVGDRKVSGHAFCFRRNVVLHHGTLLVDADLACLRECLAPSLAEIEGRAVESNRASVANLREWSSDLSIERARDEIEARVARSWPDAAGIRDVAEFVGADEIASRRAEFSSEAWRWGRTPEFRTGFDVCGHRFRFRVVAGAVAECMAGPDEAVCAALVGARFSSGAFADVFAAQGWTPGAEAAARMRF